MTRRSLRLWIGLGIVMSMCLDITDSIAKPKVEIVSGEAHMSRVGDTVPETPKKCKLYRAVVTEDGRVVYYSEAQGLSNVLQDFFCLSDTDYGVVMRPFKLVSSDTNLILKGVVEEQFVLQKPTPPPALPSSPWYASHAAAFAAGAVVGLGGAIITDYSSWGQEMTPKKRVMEDFAVGAGAAGLVGIIYFAYDDDNASWQKILMSIAGGALGSMSGAAFMGVGRVPPIKWPSEK